MFTLMRSLGFKEALARELVPLVLAFVIAEMIYKFGSFALECLAFLATWYVASGIWSLVIRVVENRSSRHDVGPT